VARPTTRTPRRLGRPPASDSGETRRRILDAGRVTFAAQGYEVATNRGLAAAADVTSGAMYHYFASKLDLYVAIYEDVQAVINERFEQAIVGLDTFLARLVAVLDASHDLNVEDRTLAQFLGAVRIDRRRHPEIDEAVAASDVSTEFFTQLLRFGRSTGEIPPGSMPLVGAVIDAFLTGLNDSLSSDNDRHAQAITALKLLLQGSLIQEPTAVATAGAPRRRKTG
jgi:AcrR family transcriptional regulator